MPSCDVCGTQVDLPYDCKGCNGTFCSEHRLPENHDCAGLADWGDPKGTFDSGFDDSVVTENDDGLLDRLGVDTGRTGLRGYVRGNVTFAFLGLMWITFFAQIVASEVIGIDRALYEAIFVLTPRHPEYVWTWFTSVFSHGGFTHILFNSVAIYFFGQTVERYIGSRDFSLLFLASGALAGLGQIGITYVQSPVPQLAPGVVGASGAALALLGVLTVLNPDMRVMIFPIFYPLPVWVITIALAVISSAGIFGISLLFPANTAHGGHLAGLVVGLVYGQYVKDSLSPPNRLRLGGGPGGGGPGGPGGPGRRRGPF
jgi:hypothetical protein